VERGYIKPTECGMRVRCFEALPETATFVAHVKGEIAGVLSVVGDTPEFGLPADRAFKGEIDLRGIVRGLIARGTRAALPVVVESGTPLEFWAWQPRMKMARGVWNIPVPGERVPVRPGLLLVPLVGFDPAGYRLGYGGGYYDRTLAAMHPRPYCIGVGFELGRLDSIRPQPHDIPMDMIVTERGVQRYQRP